MTATAQGAAIFGCEGPVLGKAEAAFFRDFDPLGFIIFARNVETPEQLRRLTADLRNAIGRDAMILVDQEGGRVQRLRAPHWREWPTPIEMVESAGQLAAPAMALRSRIIAKELRAVGIDANCAPVADIASALTHPFLRNRCYAEDAARVVEIATAVAEGHLAEGVLPVIKHMPGHGRSTVDTHLDLPKVTASRADLIDTDFAPFAALADLPMAMTAHIIFTAFDANNPATQSRPMITMIREDIGFKGLLLTDDLNMEALSGGLGERTARSLQAGCDIALHCKGDLAQMIEVATAAGSMRPESVLRADSALARRGSVSDASIEALDAELHALLSETSS